MRCNASVTKRISVVFRGSVTAKDFMVDVDEFIVEINHPSKPDSKEKLGVHKGFYGTQRILEFYANANWRLLTFLHR